MSPVFQNWGYTFYDWIHYKNGQHVCRNAGRPRPGAAVGLDIPRSLISTICAGQQNYQIQHRQNVFHYAHGELGMSIHFPETEDRVLLGAPGVFNWQGKFHCGWVGAEMNIEECKSGTSGTSGNSVWVLSGVRIMLFYILFLGCHYLWNLLYRNVSDSVKYCYIWTNKANERCSNSLFSICNLVTFVCLWDWSVYRQLLQSYTEIHLKGSYDLQILFIY